MIDLAKIFNDLPVYLIEIGVITVKKRKKEKKKKDEEKKKKRRRRKKKKKIETEEEKVSVGVTNAELMFIHENGSVNIPHRPVLQMTIDYANKELLQPCINRCIKKYLDTFDVKVIDKELSQLCMRMEDYARELIYSNDGRLTANAESTIKKKGFNHPLFQTGQLARSITCRLIKL